MENYWDKMLKITDVEVGEADYSLLITWSDGSTKLIDLTEKIFTYKIFLPLRDPVLFREVKVGEWGWDITWGGDMEIPAEQLWELSN